MPLRSRAARVGWTLLGLQVLAAICAPWVGGADPFALGGDALRSPDARHWFGTDDLGRDVLASVVYGARTSLQVGLFAAALSTAIGMSVGGLAGLRSGAVDQVLMRGTEFVQAIPRFFLVVLAVSLLGSHHWLIVLLIGVTAWPATARLFRAQVMTLLNRDFVLASRAAGSPDRVVLVRHILPHASAVVAAEASYQVGGAILAEAGLSFLGLGDPSVMSWGSLLGSAQHFVREAWWMSLFPGLAVTVTILGCNLVAGSLASGEGDHV
jgi:peptide/nickel transport system permease protein